MFFLFVFLFFYRREHCYTILALGLEMRKTMEEDQNIFHLLFRVFLIYYRVSVALLLDLALDRLLSNKIFPLANIRETICIPKAIFAFDSFFSLQHDMIFVSLENYISIQSFFFIIQRFLIFTRFLAQH